MKSIYDKILNGLTACAKRITGRGSREHGPHAYRVVYVPSDAVVTVASVLLPRESSLGLSHLTIVTEVSILWPDGRHDVYQGCGNVFGDGEWLAMDMETAEVVTFIWPEHAAFRLGPRRKDAGCE